MWNRIVSLVGAAVGVARRFRLPSPVNLVGILENAADAKRRIRGVAGYRKATAGGTILGVAVLVAVGVVALTDAKRPTPGSTIGSAPGSPSSRGTAALGSAGSSGGLYLEAGNSQLWDLPRLPGDEPIELPPGEVYQPELARRVEREGDAFLFEYRVKTSGDRPTTASTWQWVAAFTAKPSATVPGDLDQVALYMPWLATSGREQSEIDVRASPPHPLKHPLTSYLHRIDDARLREYTRLGVALLKEAKAQAQPDGRANWAAVQDSSDARALLDVTRQMVAAVPRDAFRHVLYMNALVVRHDMEGLRKELEEWRPQLEATGALRPDAWRLAETLRANDLTAAGRNGRDFVVSLTDREAGGGTPARLARLPEILRYDDYGEPFAAFESWPNLLPLQTDAKVFATATELSLLGGDRRSALETSVSNYHLGQLMTQNGTLINRLIGTAIRSIAVQSLRQCVLNGCERPEEVQAALQRLDWLSEREKRATQEELFAFESRVLMYADGEAGVRPNTMEVGVRGVAADARLQLTRMAASAWYCWLKNGQFPKGAGQFELLPGGVAPRDPFDPTSATLRFAERPDALVCYSVGPDGEDGGGAVTYDPSNGTKSAGDITLEVPHERKYPFPAGGVKARDKADLLRQFPNGLPADLFASWERGIGQPPLGVTDTLPVCIYSRGPDSVSAADEDSNERRSGRPVYPLIAYDPTNGTNSAGDISIAVPTPGPQVVAPRRSR